MSGYRSSACRVTEIASRYVATLPHVRYTAVGNNFQSVIRHPSHENYLKKRFLKEGPWIENLAAVGFRLIYPLESGKLTLAIDGGQAV